MGSPEVLATEVVLDAIVLLGLRVDWLVTDESVAEAVWFEMVLLCESVAVVRLIEVLLEPEFVVREALELICVEKTPTLDDATLSLAED